MLNRLASAAAATALAAGLVATAPQAVTAAPPPTPAPATDQVSPDLLQAMQRDLGLDEDAARARLSADARAATAERSLRAALGDRFGGAWLAGGDTVMVAVTDEKAASEVRAAGAEPTLVARGENQLTKLKDTLDANATKASRSITGWHVDVADNAVVVRATPAGATAAKEFATASGLPADVVRVETAAEAPRPLYDIRGGDAYHTPVGRCSVGFAVSGGFVTAGHCGTVGQSTEGSNGVAQGTFQGSSFPGNDYAWVATNGSWTPQPHVNDYAGGVVTVSGSAESAVGSSVCRSGSTTGWHCGTIQSKNETVNYAEGAVSGMTRTSACAEPGDSGGSWLTGNQAQGVTSGGSGNCTSGGTTFFQPVNEILAAYGLSLVTG
ncbi:S1 family peptidase [Plantactinospora sp. GCM10030261]|uniref:S1 family peptidase n=1 Tax=Plantactinospora sp. GCM10030261 TaxID=3273420 RepID=UPI00361EEBB8